MLVVVPVLIMLMVTHGGSALILLLNVKDDDGDTGTPCQLQNSSMKSWNLRLTCKHFFHLPCAQQLKSNFCPLCRSPFARVAALPEPWRHDAARCDAWAMLVAPLLTSDGKWNSGRRRLLTKNVCFFLQLHQLSCFYPLRFYSLRC